MFNSIQMQLKCFLKKTTTYELLQDQLLFNNYICTIKITWNWIYATATNIELKTTNYVQQATSYILKHKTQSA